jgi:hypothetical protein
MNNDPAACRNAVFVFEGDVVPAGRSPIATAPVTSSVPSGSVALSGRFNFSAQYLFAYSVGPSTTQNGKPAYPNVVATALRAADGPAQVFSPSLAIDAATTNIILFNYAFPIGSTPRQNGAWIGVWAGEMAALPGAPLAAAPIAAAQSSGGCAVTGLQIAMNGTYTAALFASGYSTNPTALDRSALAVLMWFSTAMDI